MTRLSVNVNKIATLRNARGGNVPDVFKAAQAIVGYGAHGITVHPRPDERHIRKSDVYQLGKNLNVEFNIEGYPSDDYITLVHETRPEQATLVPDPPDVLTSNAGWDVVKNQEFLAKVITELKKSADRVSLFIDPYDIHGSELEIAKDVGADRIELYTEAYAKAYGTSDQERVTRIYKNVGEKAIKCGLEINAGHDLDQNNLTHFLTELPFVAEVSIGHALISEALYDGLEKTVQNYLKCLPKQQ
jgi:pyridoxine 5-phosphate synthase